MLFTPCYSKFGMWRNFFFYFQYWQATFYFSSSFLSSIDNLECDARGEIQKLAVLRIIDRYTTVQ